VTSACLNARRTAPGRRDRRRQRGFSLIEATVSVLIVGGMFAVALNTLGASKRTQYLTGTRGRGQLLAQALMGEILSLRYEELDDPDSFGLEGSENSAKRDLFDDVDDYSGWSASPPQNKDGIDISSFEGWSRAVAVTWVDPDDLMTPVGAATGVKRITVTIKRGEMVIASAVAIRAQAWPENEDDSLKVLFVVTDAAVLTPQEFTRKTMMESWGFKVTVIAASDTEEDIDYAAGKARADVAYVPDTINGSELGTKLRDTTIGVVNEDTDLYDDFGFSSSARSYANNNAADIIDNQYYITSLFSAGAVTIFASGQHICSLDGSISPDIQALAKKTEGPFYVLTVLETGAHLYDGATAAGRRVHLPWGNGSFDIYRLTGSGKTIMRRSIEWAANKEEE